MTQPLDLARLLGRKHVELAIGFGEPDGRRDLGAIEAECGEAYVAVAVELGDVGGYHRADPARSPGTGQTGAPELLLFYDNVTP
jgi:hypothetical protein